MQTAIFLSLVKAAARSLVKRILHPQFSSRSVARAIAPNLTVLIIVDTLLSAIRLTRELGAARTIYFLHAVATRRQIPIMLL